MTMADYIEQMRRMVPMTPYPQEFQPLQPPPSMQGQQQRQQFMPPGLSLEMNLAPKRSLQDLKPQLKQDPLSPFWLQYNREF